MPPTMPPPPSRDSPPRYVDHSVPPPGASLATNRSPSPLALWVLSYAPAVVGKSAEKVCPVTY